MNEREREKTEIRSILGVIGECKCFFGGFCVSAAQVSSSFPALITVNDQVVLKIFPQFFNLFNPNAIRF